MNKFYFYAGMPLRLIMWIIVVLFQAIVVWPFTGGDKDFAWDFFQEMVLLRVPNRIVKSWKK